ncbi:ArsR/SmtB family transcription factor [Streptomyces sp. NRRL S-1868]|uniref:ArsR/SmtB family transcription factor n=1 Tax=Streptomyces sp. NRRL S-1868 TaxID=1463892 RepID=UPI00099D8923|nr:winged helix-turn-helix domain-containing protein [Streptomyces sp. NRRL S-1868]
MPEEASVAPTSPSSPSAPSSGSGPSAPPTGSGDPADRNAEAVTLDTRGLRALAHPVRVQLLGLLRMHGPATATQLALRLNLNTGVTSYHLRQLDAAGFVAEDRERGNGRERWWRAAHQETRMDCSAMIERDPEATDAYLRSVAATDTLLIQRAVNGFPTMPRAWQDVADFSDFRLRLTPDEAAALRTELREVVGRYRKDTPGQAPGAPADAEPVTLVSYLLPDPAGRPEADGERDEDEGAHPGGES